MSVESADSEVQLVLNPVFLCFISAVILNLKLHCCPRAE